MASYKQKCIVCKKEYVLVKSYRDKAICATCKMRDISAPVTDEKYKEMFDLPVEIYMRNSFLRDIKEKFLKFGSLSEKQVEMFRKVAADEMKAKDKI